MSVSVAGLNGQESGTDCYWHDSARLTAEEIEKVAAFIRAAIAEGVEPAR
jgi:hypothetical protein